MSESFDALVRTDPLFAAEGLDIGNARHAIDRLEETIARFEAVLAKNSWKRAVFLTRYPLSRYAIPIAFLRSFLDSEEARRTYIREPSADKGRTLVDAWRTTARALLDAVRRHERLHRIFYALEREGPSFVFNDMMGNSTTIADVDSTVAMLVRNALHVSKEADARRATFFSGRPYRPEHLQAFSPLPKLEKGEPDAVHRKLHTLFKRHERSKIDVAESFGPLWYQLPHFDAAPTRHLFTFDIGHDRRNDIAAARLSLVDKFYFLPLIGPDARFGNIGRANFEVLIQRKIRYWIQPATYFYTSRDQRYWADIATLVDRERRPSLDALALDMQRSSLFDLILGTCVGDIRIYTAHTAERIARDEFKGYSLLFGLLMRSHPSIYFLPFNRSVYRLAEAPQFLRSKRIPDNEQLYVNEDTVLPEVTDDELEEIMRGSEIRSAGRQQEGLIV